MTKASTKQRTARLLALGISVALSLVLLELVARWIVPLDTGSSFDYRVPDAELGWVLAPGERYRNHLPERNASVAYSSVGWRDVEHALDKPAGVTRVLVSGDSFMEAYSVNLDEAFHRRLQQDLREQGFEVETINSGVGGYGTLQQYLSFSLSGRRYAPDLVLLGMYVANDVCNNSLELETMLAGGGIKATSRPFLRSAEGWDVTQIDYAGARARYERVRLRDSGPVHRLARRSVLLRLTVDAVDGLLDRDDGGGGPEDPLARRMAMYGVHYCDEPAEFTRAWELTERILARFAAEVAEAGGRLVVFSVPALEEVEPQTAKSGPGPPVCWDSPPGYARLAALLARQEIPYIDLLPRFREATERQDHSLFWRSDRHWNPQGHALAAEIVTDELIARGLLVGAAR